jgi:hypothetical protein
MVTPAMGKIVTRRASFYFFFSFFILKAVFVFVFSSSVIWLAFPGGARVSMTWLNLLSVQPRGRTSYRFQDRPEKRTEPIL